MKKRVYLKKSVYLYLIAACLAVGLIGGVFAATLGNVSILP